MLVFIIEPDHILAKQYKKIFERVGIKVKLCNNAQGAINMIDETKPDAVILELQLAGHSGIEFLNEFRSYSDWAEIPVFVYSNVPKYSFGVDEKTWSNLGIERYLYKSDVPLNALLGIVKSKLNK
jgi:DNA-binding response OmpR family regulator